MSFLVHNHVLSFATSVLLFAGVKRETHTVINETSPDCQRDQRLPEIKKHN